VDREGYDAGIRPALRELNRLTGVRTRSSCQGRAAPDERSSHAEFAYVLFRTPVPLAFEEHLLAELGDLARIEPDSLYCRWPERNAELCERLAETARAFRRHPRTAPTGETRIPLAALLGPLEAWLREPEAPPVAWCFTCAALRAGKAACAAHDPLVLLDPGPRRALATFDSFLASDPSPPDPKLREREGDAAVLARVERGDFGASYRRAWRRFVGGAARQALRVEVRARVAGRRAAGRSRGLLARTGESRLSQRAREPPPAPRPLAPNRK
jgi:hypothetical protein